MNRAGLMYFPLLHPTLAPAGLSGDVTFLSPLQNSLQDGPFLQTPARSWPLDPAQARVRLSALLAMGGDLAGKDGRMLDTSAHEAARGYMPHEVDVETFLTQGSEEAQRRADSAAESFFLLNAQLTLLLAWHLEECMIDMHTMEDEVRRRQDQLEQSLGISSGEAPSGAVIRGQASPQWAKVWAAQVPFTPKSSRFITCDEAIVAELAEKIAFTECAEDEAHRYAGREGARLWRARFAPRSLFPVETPMARTVWMREPCDVYFLRLSGHPGDRL